jgi:hypothetical protein
MFEFIWLLIKAIFGIGLVGIIMVIIGNALIGGDGGDGGPPTLRM